MTQKLRVLVALLEDLGSLSSAHVAAQFQEIQSAFLASTAPGTQVVRRHTCKQNTDTLKKKKVI